jgi:hypothetical protein
MAARDHPDPEHKEPPATMVRLFNKSLRFILQSYLVLTLNPAELNNCEFTAISRFKE